MKLVSLALCAEAAWAYKLSFEFGDEQSNNATSPRLLPLDGFYPDSWDCEHVQPVPSKVRRTYKLDDFYQKYTHAYGIPILSSSPRFGRAPRLLHDSIHAWRSARLAQGTV